jgi:ankyrin repeat protein
MDHASSTGEIEDTQSVIYELALQVLHPEHETFQLWSCLGHLMAYDWEDHLSNTTLRFCKMGLPKLTARLLVLGVRSVTRSRSGRTALHLASEHGHLEVVKMLLDGPNIVMNPAVVGSDEQLHIIELADVNAKDDYLRYPP